MRARVSRRDSQLGECVEKCASGLDRKIVSQSKEMLIAGDQNRVFVLSEREEIFVTRIIGTVRTCLVRCNERRETKKGHELRCVSFRNPAANFWVRKCPLEFAEQRLGHDQFESAVEPAAHDLCWRAAPGEQSRDEDIGVENCAH